MSVLFPHGQVRNVQKQMMDDVSDALEKRRHLVVHAPTGLGKTAATLSPALDLALKRDLVVFFLTSRHTQHKIVLDTLQAIRKKHGINFTAASIIGKKWMCIQPGVTTMRSNDFFPYCKALRESKSCEPYENVKQKNSMQCDIVLKEAEKQSPLPTEEVISRCSEKNLCPYELSLLLAEKSKVIVTDYYYLLHPHIRSSFLKKAKKKLDQAIIIFDEGHNLPSRARELMTQRISSRLIMGAAKEAKKYRLNDLAVAMSDLGAALESLAGGLRDGGEKLVKCDDFTSAVSKFAEPEELVAKLNAAADIVRQDKQRSLLGAIAEFIGLWQEGEEGFSRILVKQNNNIQLSKRCLDPSLATKELIEGSYCTVTMSGTLSPANVFADLLGIPAENRQAKEYPSPFPAQNRLAIVVPRTTTKFSQRSDSQYRSIAEHCAKITNAIPGCSAIFFPSYQIRDAVNNIFSPMTGKTLFLEQPNMTKDQKQDFLERFKSYKESGAVLLAVASGSFGEGIDLPGILKGIIIVGLPLDRPNLETQQLIEYYDKKFGKGWDYGYTMPALTKCMQNAGRCIRSETDRGAIVFLDERYAWPRYFTFFPSDWNLKISPDPLPQIGSFFSKT
ncbi:MAG: ATP-dependent DNA helicase [Candidatus Woesearchaeota archaeon]